VTGARPFQGATQASIFDAILNRAPVAPSLLNADVPAELERVILKATEKDRALRYQTAADLLADLRRIQRDATGEIYVKMLPSGQAVQLTHDSLFKTAPVSPTVRASSTAFALTHGTYGRYPCSPEGSRGECSPTPRVSDGSTPGISCFPRSGLLPKW